MMLDFTSLLLAIGFSGLCLSLTMLAFWLSARQDRFLVTWSISLMLIAVHVFNYWLYSQNPSQWLGAVVIVTLPLAASLIYASAWQFIQGLAVMPRVAMLMAPFLVLVSPFLVLGYDGISLIIHNAAVALIFTMTGLVYWENRGQSPVFMSLLTLLYTLTGISFALCGLVILWEGQWIIGHAPDNWAERLNIIVAVSCMTGIGALSLALNQSRLAGRHRQDAMTDPLSGLMNRRALLHFHDQPFGRHKAIVMFDLDRFKAVNDVYGHAVGDEVIRRFAAALTKHSRPRDDVVRLGGEEFALIMDRVTPEQARRAAERISRAFGDDTLMTALGELHNTVSAGIGFGDDSGASLEEVLGRADQALYRAKNGGRNRIEGGAWRLTG